MFIDHAKIYVKAGDGGNGCVSFRREKCVPFGGPNGGNGGNGGNVIISAVKGQSTLLHFRYKQHFKVISAGDGEGSNRTGKSSEDLIVYVPVGTSVRDTQTGDILDDLVKAGQRLVVALGGTGGKGNAEFATAVNQAPKNAQEGLPGEEKTLILELKLFADVGLVGFPNAGKSTFLSRVSAARPKIADYPFTTLEPQLGVVEAGKQSYVVADIPGIIEGAHAGKGLGFEFLKHIERTRFLLILIDTSETTSQESPLEVFTLLMEELKLYSSELAGKDYAVVGTKCDVMGDAQGYKELEAYLKDNGKKFDLISAVRGDGIENLLIFLGQKVKEFD